MNINSLKRKLAIAFGITTILSGAAVYSAMGGGMSPCILCQPEISQIPAPALRSTVSATSAHSGAVVVEWNQHAAALTVLPASALAPVQQGRVMAIFHLAVHDAVNGITNQYRTYLSPGPAPANASPEAAAIAAAHHALRSLFPTQAASLDSLYTASLAAHSLSPDDPGIEYGRAAAAAILAARANDRAAQAQFNYRARRAGSPGVWVPITAAPALLAGWGNVTPVRTGKQLAISPCGPARARQHSVC